MTEPSIGENWLDVCADLQAQMINLRMSNTIMENTVRELQMLTAELVGYAKHKPECPATMRRSPGCICGFTETLRKYEATR